MKHAIFPEVKPVDGIIWTCDCGESGFDVYDLATHANDVFDQGALGLFYDKVGQVAQAIASCLVDRGYTTEQIVSRLSDTDNWDEATWWERHGGDIIDNFADFIDLTAWPEEDE